MSLGITAAGWAAIGAVGSVGASVYNAKKARDQAAAMGGPGGGQVDIDYLDKRARGIAQQNAQDSDALERAMSPEVNQLRHDSTNQVLQQMNPSGADEWSQNKIMGLSNSNVAGANTPLLRAAIDKARSNLALGGGLDRGTQNEVTRRGLATAGTVGGGSGLGLGRDVVARDLGLSSLGLERQRLMDASLLGGQELALSAQDTNTAFNNRANQANAISLMQNLQRDQFGRAMGAAQFSQAIPKPVVGLDPGSVVDLSVGNANNAQAARAQQANISGAQSQNWGQLAGALGGYALMNYNNSGAQTTPMPYNNTQRPNPNYVGYTG